MGRELGRTDRVISSPAVRAVETARGLGRVPDSTDLLWQELGEAVLREMPWPCSFESARSAVREVGRAAREKARELWDSVGTYLEGVPDGGGLLIVTHGGFCELLVAGSALPFDFEAAGGPIRCMEGVRFVATAGVPTAVQLLRLPDDVTRV